MGKSSVKARVIQRKGDADGFDMDGFTDILSSLTGTGPADLHIVLPKMCIFRKTLEHLEQLFSVLAAFPLSGELHKNEIIRWFDAERIDWQRFPQISAEIRELETYCRTNNIDLSSLHKDTAAKLMGTVEGADMSKLKNANIDLALGSNDLDSADGLRVSMFISQRQSSVSEVDLITISREITEIRQLPLINTYAVIMSNLLSIRIHIKEEQFATVPNLFFIKELPGYSFQPLENICTIDFKTLLLSSTVNESNKRFLLSFLAKAFRYTLVLTKLNSTPDINIHELTNGIIGGIIRMKSELPRCGKAFSVIEQSASLLEEQFNGYFLTFRSTNSPTVIIESYLSDLNKTFGKDSPELVRQFRQLINHVKKKVQTAKQNGISGDIPMDKFNSAFALFDKLCGGVGGASSSAEMPTVSPDDGNTGDVDEILGDTP